MPSNKSETLQRGSGERERIHRALLLYAMVAPDLRARRAVARAMGNSESSVRLWRTNERWEHRIEYHGEDADQIALDLYRELYMEEFGELELPHVTHGIVRPLGAVHNSSPLAAATELTRERVRVATGLTKQETEQRILLTAAQTRSDSKKVAARHIRLVDGALGVIVSKIKTKKITVSVRDIPFLIECREKLTRIAEGGEDGGAGRIVESARVKYARESGGDLLEAMAEDAEECVIILGALRSRQGVDLGQLSKDDEEAREAQGVPTPA